MNLDDYFNLQYLHKLYNERLSNSKAKGIDKLNSESFNKNKNEVIETICRKVLSNTYEFSPYTEVLKLKGRSSLPRIISIPTIRDRIVLLTIKEILHEEFSKNVNRRLPNSYIRDIKKYIASSDEPVYFLKLDVEKFYDRIDQTLLLEKLQLNNLDNRIVTLIARAISTPTVPMNSDRTNYNLFASKVGVPQGLSVSNILAQIYLDELDHVIDKRKYFYRRYVDDIIILNSSVISKFRFENIKLALEKVKLNLNENKTEQGSLDSGFSFLSYKIMSNKISIADKNVQVFIRRIAGKFTWFKNGIDNINRRPAWLAEDERFKEVFIEELNEAITGIISSRKNYGWLFYFSEMNDESLLFKLDKIITEFFTPLTIFENSAPASLKTLVRSFNVIKHKGNKHYLSNYDNYDSIRSKRSFLLFRGKIDPAEDYSDLQITSLFERYKVKQILNVEKDIGYRYM